MTEKEAAVVRHSVRQYEERPLEESLKAEIVKAVEEVNKESGLHVQAVFDEPKAFAGGMAKYGSFSGVTNYFALVGKKGMDEEVGYYGERLVLLAQTLGLNTCWVALTFKKVKDAFVVRDGEKLYMVISLGYGKTQGVAHKNKPMEKVAERKEDDPDWFVKGVEGALLAPTAVNQQKFFFSHTGREVVAKPGLGFYTVVDLGIAKYHFELAAGKENFTWAK